MRAPALLVVALAACSPSKPPGMARPDTPAKPAETPVQLTNRLLGELAQAAGCAQKERPRSVFCAAADWGQCGLDDRAMLPPLPALLVGVAIVIPDGTPMDEVMDAGTGHLHLAAMGLRADETQRFVRVAALVPSTPEEQALVEPVVVDTTRHFAGGLPAVTLPKDLAQYLADLPGAANYPLARVENGGWTWSGKSDGELRRVCDHWVTVELPRNGEKGLTVTVFTDKVK
jgi:hypothetical protein